MRALPLLLLALLLAACDEPPVNESQDTAERPEDSSLDMADGTPEDTSGPDVSTDTGPPDVPPTPCDSALCSDHGLCAQDTAGTITCSCETGYLGEICDTCDEDAGYLPDGSGGCVTNPCEPNPCELAERNVCTVVEGAALCECSAGYHDDNGACILDTTCTSTTCNGQGTCSESNGTVGCVCTDGYTGAFCDACDEDAGFHDDGAGGCTDDVCIPNPCTGELESCTELDEAPTCVCNTGAHRELDVCVIDEVCTSTTCNGDHGTCSVVEGLTTCTCGPGYTGEACEACDEVAGFHDDGAGGCTDDPCVPSPCSAPNQSQCADDGAGNPACSCDPGFHDNGVGGCTDDPCVPNTCIMQNMACRDDGSGNPECYTPTCDDNNPCTDDAVFQGSCSHNPLDDGTPCSTTLCEQDQVCSGGQCGTGTPVTCNDSKPCTRDTCNDITGCVYTPDDSLKPNDSIACTTDACVDGAAVHTPSNSLCDDTLFCNGEELCSPQSSNANSMGCITTNIPTPPGPSTPCRYYDTCDENSKSYPLVELSSGDPCNDGIACTSNDTCATTGGLCAGTLTLNCDPSATTCTSTIPFPPVIDLLVARITGSVTVEQAAPASPLISSYTDDLFISAVAQDTGSRHRIAELSWDYSSGSYVLGSGDDVINTSLLPGVYDILYERGRSTAYPDRVRRTQSANPIPYGHRYLMRDVVFGAGDNTLELDIRIAEITGSVTVEQAAPASPLVSSYTDDLFISAVAKDTGSRHRIAELSWDYSSGSYVLGSGDDVIDTSLLPGTYDILYERGRSGSYDDLVRRTQSANPIPYGHRYLMRDVVLTEGANALDIDIDIAELDGTITVEQAAPASPLISSYTDDLFISAVAQDTGSRHRIAELSWDYSSGSYVLGAGDDVIDTSLLPGVYDILYERGRSTAYPDRVRRTQSANPIAYGHRYLMRDVLLSAGANALDLDIRIGEVDGVVTVEQAAPASPLISSYTDDLFISAVAQDTGSRHRIAELSWDYSSGSYVLGAGDDVIDTSLLPGTYDILYERGRSGSYPDRVRLTQSANPIPYGHRYLMRDIVIVDGANTLNVDIDIAALNGSVTVEQAAPASPLISSYTDDLFISAVAQDTGSRHRIAELSWDYSSGSYVLGAGDDVIDTSLVPGTYDILYERGRSTAYPDRVRLTQPANPIPYGHRYLMRDVVLGAGDNTLDIDIDIAALNSLVTLEGQSIPSPLISSYTDDLFISMVARDTRSRHRIAELSWDYSSGSYVLGSGDDVIDTSLVPGTYDILYERGRSGSYPDRVRLTQPANPIPYGHRYLDVCVTVP